jgi:hypothetical protein
MTIWHKLKEPVYGEKQLTNKLYVKRQLYGLQTNEKTDFLEQLSKFNMSKNGF